MKQLTLSLNNIAFYLILISLFLINISISGCEIVLTLVVIIFFIHVFLTKKLPFLPFYFLLFGSYILFTLFSSLFSINWITSWHDNKELLIFLLIPIFILFLDTEKKVTYSLYAILGSSTLSALVGIFTTIKNWRLDTDHRLKGFTSHWMTYSELLMMSAAFFFVIFFYTKSKSQRRLIGISWILMFIAILLSLTRSVWIGLLTAILIFVIFSKPKILWLLMPMIILGFFVLPQPIKNRIYSIIDISEQSNRDRLYMWQTGWRIIGDFPLTGVGPDNIGAVYPTYMPREAQKTNNHLHNNFLQILAERGIFAFISFIMCFLFLIIQVYKKIKLPDNWRKAISKGVLLIIISFLVAGLFDYNFGYSQIKIMLFYFISLPFLGIYGKSLQNNKEFSFPLQDKHD